MAKMGGTPDTVRNYHANDAFEAENEVQIAEVILKPRSSSNKTCLIPIHSFFISRKMC
jgi:hypothetical protein